MLPREHAVQILQPASCVVLHGMAAYEMPAVHRVHFEQTVSRAEVHGAASNVVPGVQLWQAVHLEPPDGTYSVLVLQFKQNDSATDAFNEPTSLELSRRILVWGELAVR